MSRHLEGCSGGHSRWGSRACMHTLLLGSSKSQLFREIACTLVCTQTNTCTTSGIIDTPRTMPWRCRQGDRAVPRAWHDAGGASGEKHW
eukprot:351465-Chlamydomonas_euryale.AAC.6